ncbi:hypothetical protein MMC20_006709 [Loxospora ochrophaea]|nr:hypothetical protein [Loxospora ochrophaea]
MDIESAMIRCRIGHSGKHWQSSYDADTNKVRKGNGHRAGRHQSGVAVADLYGKWEISKWIMDGRSVASERPSQPIIPLGISGNPFRRGDGVAHCSRSSTVSTRETTTGSQTKSNRPALAYADRTNPNRFATRQTASELPAKQKKLQTSPLVRSICQYACQHGLTVTLLRTLLDHVTRANFLDQTSAVELIGSLYPAAKVPSGLVCIVVNSLGQGKQKPSLAIQSSLLKWLVLTHEVLEDSSILSKLYSVLFNLLDMISLRPNLCHLLAIITRRRHVKPFRIQSLLQLSSIAANEPSILGLVQVYKRYYPDIIVGSNASRKASQFAVGLVAGESMIPTTINITKHPDLEWRDRLHAVQDLNVDFSADTRDQSSFKVIRKGVKRSRVMIIPEVHTYHAEESSTTLEEVESVDDLIERLEKIELPSQAIAVLDDPLLQKYLAIRPTKPFLERLQQWLAMFFDEYVQTANDPKSNTEDLWILLEKALSYTRHTKVLLKSVENFLRLYIPTWDGQDHRDLVLDLLAFSSLQSFKEFRISTLDPLESSVLDNTASSLASLLSFYNSLLRHWTSQLLSRPAPTQETSLPLTSLADHASLLSLTLLIHSPATISTISTILTYHETLSYLISHAPTNPAIRITIPSTSTIYLLLFTHHSSSLPILSRLCSILATYKLTFETTMSQPSPNHHQQQHHLYSRPYINHFNGFLMDICNLLWRSRAFNTSDTNALGCLLPSPLLPSLRSYSDTLSPPQPLQHLFSLSNHPALSSLSIASFRALEDDKSSNNNNDPATTTPLRTRHAGPVTQRSLALLAAQGGLELGWADYRIAVLRYLEVRGVKGVPELMQCTMRVLMGAGAAAGGTTTPGEK